MCDKKYGYIYLITNKINNKKYVGQTIYTPEWRWNYHLQDCRKKNNDGSWRRTNYLYNSIRKHGKDAFKIEPLVKVPVDKLNEAEKYYIKLYNTYEGEGYNETVGGETSPMSNPEVCKKVSNSLKEHYKTHEHHMKGIHPTKDHRSKISKAKHEFYQTTKGIKNREKLSNRMKGHDNPSYKKAKDNQLIYIRKVVNHYSINKKKGQNDYYYGSYKTVEEAIEIRNILIANDWDKSKLSEELVFKIENSGKSNYAHIKGKENWSTKYSLWNVEIVGFSKQTMFRNGDREPNPCRCFSLKYNAKQLKISMFEDFISPMIIHDLIKNFLT